MADFTFNMIPEGAGVGKVIFPILKNGDCGVSPIGQIYLSVGGIKSDEDQIEGTKIEIQIGEDPRLKAIAIESEYKGLIAAFIKDCPEQLALENSMFTLTKIVPGTFSSEDDISGPTLPSWEPETLLFSENGMNEIGMIKGGMGHYYIPEDHVKVVTLFTGTEIFEQEIGTESAGAILNENELGEEAEEVGEMEYEITYTAK